MSPHASLSDTNGSQTRESIIDTVNGPGLALLLFGILVLGSTLTAGEPGFNGWTLIGVLVSAVCLAVGATVVRIEHHRARTDGPISGGRDASTERAESLHRPGR